MLLSLYDPDVTSALCETAKSNFFNHLKKSVPTVTVPPNTPKISHRMALFQKLPPTLRTFGDIYDYILNKIMKRDSRVCFLVTHSYLKKSVKSLETKGRSNFLY